MKSQDWSYRPDLSKSGLPSKEAPEAVFTWFSPIELPNSRFRYAVIKEEDGVLSIAPGEGRFKAGLQATRWEADKGGDGTTYLVVKTRPNRIDLKKA